MESALSQADTVVIPRVDRIPPLVKSTARIMRRSAHDLVGVSDEDWAESAALVILSQPMVAGAFEKAATHSLVKIEILGLHQPRVWGIEDMHHVAPIREIKQCIECHKSYPCPTVQAYGVTE